MTATNFPVCLSFTLGAEGGWSDNPHDPGGATMRGITLHTFQGYKAGATKQELRNISDKDVAAIYRHGYWAPVRGDDLPAGIDLMVFDFGVNAGPDRAVLELQQVVGVKADGILGPISLAAVAKAPATETITKLSGLQRAYYRSLPTWGEFGHGWMNRTDARVTAALRLLPARTINKTPPVG